MYPAFAAGMGAIVHLLPVVFEQSRSKAATKLACAADDKIEHRLWITWRGRHRLEHIDGGGLVLDPFVELRVAVSQFSDPRSEFLGLRSLTC